MKLQTAVSWASLIFLKRFQDAISSQGMGNIVPHCALSQIIATTKQKKKIFFFKFDKNEN